MKSHAISAVAVGALGAAATFAKAEIISTSGSVTVITPPASVMEGALESNELSFVFAEASDHLLTRDLGVDLSQEGVYESFSPMTAGTITSGTFVNSYFFHKDTVGQTAPDILHEFTVEFGEPIIGVIVLGDWRNGEGGSSLDESAFLGGPIEVEYPTNAHGASHGTLDSTWPLDNVTVMPDMRTLHVSWVSNAHAMDQMRVITRSAIPAPGALVLLGLAGMVTGRRRRGR